MQKKTKPDPKEQNTEDEKNIEEWKSKYLRALADYQNLEKRTGQQFAQYLKRSNKRLLTNLLVVLDNIDRAEVFVKDPGLKLVKDEFFKILTQEGVEEIEIMGKAFDPYLAECVEVVEGLENDIVTEVLAKGYRLNGEVLRPAQVKVSKKIENSKNL